MILPAGMRSANVTVWPQGPLELRFNGAKVNTPFTQRLSCILLTACWLTLAGISPKDMSVYLCKAGSMLEDPGRWSVWFHAFSPRSKAGRSHTDPFRSLYQPLTSQKPYTAAWCCYPGLLRSVLVTAVNYNPVFISIKLGYHMKLLSSGTLGCWTIGLIWAQACLSV